MRVSFTQHFREHELKCACGECDYPGMDATFMHTLERIRQRFQGPMRLSSAFRCPDYNARVSSTGHNGPHTTGRAVDVLVSGRDAYRLLRIALAEGVDGIGVNQKGPHQSRFIHLDDISSELRPWIWSY